jgi:GNAT superfamily N-acetyltransferase
MLSFMGTGRSDYLDFIYPREKPEVLGEIVKFLGDHRGDWDTIDLERVPEQSETARSLRAACSENGLYCLITDRIPCPTLKFAYDSAGDVIRPAEKKTSRREARQASLRRQKGYRVEHLTDGSAIAGYLELLFDQHVARWSLTDTPSLFVDGSNRAFYRELVTTMGPTGWIVFTVLEILGKPVGFLLSFAYGSRLLGYKLSFDVSLAKRSPGDALLKEAFDYAIGRRLDEYDFSVGDEPYKLRFANQVRHAVSYRVFGTRRRFWIGGGWTALKRQARKTPAGRALARRAARLRQLYIPLARQVIKKRGPVRFVWSVARRLWGKLIFEYVYLLFLEMPAGQIVEESNSVALAGVSFKEARIEDLQRFEYSDYDAMKQEFIRQSQSRFQRGGRCFIADYAGRPVCIAWFREETKTYMKEARTWVPIGPNAVTFCDQVTLPAFRSKGLAGFVLARALNALKDKKKVGYLLPANEPSRRNLLRHGFRVTQGYHMIRILGVPIRWRTDAPHANTEGQKN